MTHAVADRPLISPAEPGAPRRLLLISYHFPPVGGAGVQRPLKFVRYLAELGWQTTVLTAANPSVPVFDESLCDEIPDGTQIVRARTLEPAYARKAGLQTADCGRRSLLARLKQSCRRCVRETIRLVLQPDPQMLWHPAAKRAAVRVLREQPHDAILATAPPYSNLLLGRALGRKFHLPLVLDYRDEWDLSSRYLENSHKDPLSHCIQQWMQKRVLRQADAVIATTHDSTDRLQSRLDQAGGRGRTLCIRNGFDPGDLQSRETVPPPPAGRIRIVYTGTLWNLTSVEPLTRAVESLGSEQPGLLARFEFVFVGRKTPEQQALLDRIAARGCVVRCEDYCPHGQALAWMHSADALCLLLSDVEGAGRVIPAKLFEYLGIPRPILAIVPEGETARIVRSFGQQQFAPADHAGLARWLTDRAQAGPDRVPVPRDETLLLPFTRRHQAAQLAELLDDLAAHSTRRTP